MKAFQIPIASQASHFVQENDIFGRSFFLEFEWIEREEFWMLHVADSLDKPKVSGVRVQADWPLYTHYDGRALFTLLVQPKKLGCALDIHSLSRDFTLVAYYHHEAL